MLRYSVGRNTVREAVRGLVAPVLARKLAWSVPRPVSRERRAPDQDPADGTLRDLAFGRTGPGTPGDLGAPDRPPRPDPHDDPGGGRALTNHATA